MKHFSFKRLSKLLAAALSVSAVILVFAPFSFAESTEEFYADLLGEMGISAPVEVVFANEAPVITFTEEAVYSPVEESIYEFVPSEDPMQYADTSVWPGGQICFEDLDYADSSSWNGGRLVIGGVGINVGLYSEGGDAQAVTDAYDSACLIGTLRGNVLVGDHSNQGFDRIRNAVPGITEAVVMTGSGNEAFICREIITDGRNLGYAIAGSDGLSIEDRYENSLITYTCNSGAGNDSITIVVWERH